MHPPYLCCITTGATKEGPEAMHAGALAVVHQEGFRPERALARALPWAIHTSRLGQVGGRVLPLGVAEGSPPGSVQDAPA